MSDLQLTDRTAIAESAITYRFVRASGPGGQNVNKVASAVELRLNLDESGLPAALRKRLEQLAARRVSSDGILVIFAQRHRTQVRNREDAIARLKELIERAEYVPKRRVKTRPTLAAKKRRMDTKRQRGDNKRLRRKPTSE